MRKKREFEDGEKDGGEKSGGGNYPLRNPTFFFYCLVLSFLFETISKMIIGINETINKTEQNNEGDEAENKNMLPAYNIKVPAPCKIIRRASSEVILKRSKCGLEKALHGYWYLRNWRKKSKNNT